MKKVFLTLCMLMLALGSVNAQSSMTDDQIIKFVMKEQKAGSSQQEIVTKLMQKGVDIDQIRRVRQKAERLQKNQGLGTVKNSRPASQDDDLDMDPRMRKNNEKEKSTVKIKDEPNKNPRLIAKDEADMKAELDEFVPELLDTYNSEGVKNAKGKNENKIFGHDIFNNEDLTFEPNMNIATPENYVLGPGDAVFVDIYGASQKSEQVTISPDGFIVIEGFGPIQISGLTVAQANSRVRSQLGARYSRSKIRLSVGQTRTIVVNVMGEVKAPGTYTLSAFSSEHQGLSPQQAGEHRRRLRLHPERQVERQRPTGRQRRYRRGQLRLSGQRHW